MSNSSETTETPIQVLTIDEVFRELQGYLNHLQCSLSSLDQLAEHEGEYKDLLKQSDNIEDDLDQIMPLFKQLKQLTIQMTKPQSADEKLQLKEHKAARKVAKQDQNTTA